MSVTPRSTARARFERRLARAAQILSEAACDASELGDQSSADDLQLMDAHLRSIVHESITGRGRATALSYGTQLTLPQ